MAFWAYLRRCQQRLDDEDVDRGSLAATPRAGRVRREDDASQLMETRGSPEGDASGEQAWLAAVATEKESRRSGGDGTLPSRRSAIDTQRRRTRRRGSRCSRRSWRCRTGEEAPMSWRGPGAARPTSCLADAGQVLATWTRRPEEDTAVDGVDDTRNPGLEDGRRCPEAWRPRERSPRDRASKTIAALEELQQPAVAELDESDPEGGSRPGPRRSRTSTSAAEENPRRR